VGHLYIIREDAMQAEIGRMRMICSLYILVECPMRYCGISREMRKTNITKTTHKTKENN
jgi:hypothetical protein